MITDKESFLKKVALIPDLIENRLSLIFAIYPNIDISKREKFVENISPFYNIIRDNNRNSLTTNEEIKVDSIENWIGKDLRIKRVKLKSVRGFPNSDKPFGINFANATDSPQSMIILGSNGSGKSSIYNVIEYNYCKKIGEAQLRSLNELDDDDNKFKDYLCHLDEPYGDCMGEIEAVDKAFTLQSINIPSGVRKKINPSTHFISDNDIVCNGKLDYLTGAKNSFHNLIAESLGLKEMLQFERDLLSFLSYKRLTENNRISAIERSIKVEEEIVRNAEKAIEEKRIRLKDLEENHEKKPSDGSKNELKKLLLRKMSADFSFEFDYNAFIANVVEFNKDYEILSIQKETNGDANEIQFLTIGLELLQEAKNCPFCGDSKKKISQMNNDVTSRVELLHSINKLYQTVTKSFNIVTEDLTDLFNKIAILRSKLVIELNSLKSFSEFMELTSLENDFIEFIDSIQAEEFYRDGSKMEVIESFKLDKNAFLFNFFEINKELLSQNLKNTIEKLIEYVDKRNNLYENIEQYVFSDDLNISVFEQIVTLKNEIVDVSAQTVVSTQKIKQGQLDLSLVREQQLIYNQIKEDARIFSSYFHAALNKEVLKAFDPIKSIVEEVLKKYLESQEREAIIEIKMQADEVDTETGEILSEIITASIKTKNSLHRPLSVNKYFNTFHYRLFSTMVGVSIAMASRISTSINLPLVLDDIFYASDFENRATIERFIKKLFDLFDEYTPALPLQLILFTHDQLIFESAAKATAKTKIADVFFGKLFPSQYAKDKGDYKELIYKMPEYLPFKIMQNSLIAV